jgi:hypothetical protein
MKLLTMQLSPVPVTLFLLESSFFHSTKFSDTLSPCSFRVVESKFHIHVKQKTEYISVYFALNILVKQKGRQKFLCRMAADIPLSHCAFKFFVYAVWNRKSCYQITELCYVFERCKFQNLSTALCRLRKKSGMSRERISLH